MEKPAKLLLVDDDPDFRKSMTIILESQAYELITAKDGVECLEKVKEEPPSLIILDLLMPKLDGFGVVRELEENPRYAKYDDIPILILTAVREDASRRRYELETGLEMDVDGYIEKPVQPAELLHRVGKLLGKRGGRKKIEERFLSSLAEKGGRQWKDCPGYSSLMTTPIS